MSHILTIVNPLLPSGICIGCNNKYFKNRNDENKIITVITLEGIRRHENLEEHTSKVNPHGNTLGLKLKNLVMGFHIIVMLCNLHMCYINFSRVANITQKTFKEKLRINKITDKI